MNVSKKRYCPMCMGDGCPMCDRTGYIYVPVEE